MGGDGLVGRRRELADLEQRLVDARAGHGGVVLVEGVAGVGKTALAHSVTGRARDLGMATAWGACLEGEGASPYRPWLQILGQLERTPTQLAAPDATDTASRFQLFGEVVEALRAAAGDQGLLAVVDDLHWADVPSIKLFQFVASEIADDRLLLIGVYRGGEAFRYADLAGVLPDVQRERAASTVAIGPLALDETRELATRVLGRRPDEALLRALQDRAEGNPLFLLELLRLAQSAGHADRDLPQGVREAIRRRLAQLSAPARQSVQQAAVLGRQFRVDLIASVLGDDPFSALDEALQAGFIRTVDAGTMRFDHALTQEVAYAELPTVERQRLHRMAASALRQTHDEEDALAHHLRQAAPLGDAAEALDVTLRAAERARSQLAYEHAAFHYRAALDLLPLVAESSVRRQDLLLDVARCEFRSGLVDDAWRSCVAAADLGRADGDAATVAAAATVLRGVANSPVTDQIHALCREALAMLRGADQVREACVLAQLAISADPFADPVEPDLGVRAMRAAEATGDPDARFLALQARRTELTDIRHSLERLTLGERAIELGREIGRAEYVAWGHTWRMDAFWELSRRVQLDAELAAFTTVVEHMKEPLWLWRLTMTRASLALAEGRFDAARELADDALAIGRRGGHDGANFLHLVFCDHLAHHTGTGFASVEKAVRQFVEDQPQPAKAWLASVLEAMGRHDEAERLWRGIVPHLSAFPRRAREWIIAFTGFADMCVRFDDRASASIVYDELLPFATLQATAGAETPSRGPVALYLGKLATLLENWDAAEVHLRSALERSAAVSSPPFEAHAHLELGRLLLARRGPRDVRTANVHLRTALVTAGELSMAPLEQEASRLMGRPPDRDGPLSPREREVAALVADGLSNRQIARRLHLSERTAENHVTHILTKLGFDSRAQIAAWHAARDRED